MPRGVDAIDEAIIQGRYWTPQELSPSAWFDAKDVSTISVSTGVSEWRDKSGNGNTLLQASTSSQPAYLLNTSTGNPSIDFDGTDDFLSMSSQLDLGQEHTIFIFCKNNATITATSTVQMLLSSEAYVYPSTTTSELFFCVGGNITGGLTNERISLLTLANGGAATGVYGYGKTDQNVSGAFLMSSKFTTNGNAFSGKLNTKSDFVTQHSSGGWSSTSTRYPTKLKTIGSRFGTSFFWAGAFYEIIVFPKAISEQSINKVEGYILWKWNARNLLTASHPFINRPPMIGD